MVIEVFPWSLRKLWTEWEMRLIILLSLTCQIILMLLGNRRRYTKNLLLQITLWSAYTAADSLATFALGSILSDLNDALHTGPIDTSLELQAFWAPFFLLHLGGVDTITAYSLEDNELWLRQLLNFAVQTWLVIYVLLLGWNGTHLSILSILILVAGIINYGERTYALWCASYGQRKVRARSFSSIVENFDETQSHFEATFLVSEHLFADLLRERIEVYPSLWYVMNASLHQDKCMTTGVELIELGLALMYDGIYTKTKVSHSGWNAAMRCICFLLACISLVLFCVLNNQEKYSKTDLSITFALLTMAVLKELYGAFVFLTSYATLVWLTCFAKSKTNVFCILIMALLKRITAFSWLRSPKWSNSMGQCSLLSYSLIEEPKGRWRILKLLSLCTKRKTEEKLVETCHVVPVLSDMKEWMFAYHMNKVCKAFMARIEKRNESQVFELEDPDFGRSILVWHIVTEICYCLDRKRFPDHKKEHLGGGVETRSQNIHLSSKFSKYISRYMMYLVVMTPEMLQSGWDLSQGRFSQLLEDCRSLCTAIVREWSSVQEAIYDTQTNKKRKARILACGHFVEKYRKGFGTSSKSEVLELSVRHLEELKPDESRENESALQDRWERLSGVWMELLANAAYRCRVNQHAKLLSQGGELLTYARLLFSWMATDDDFCCRMKDRTPPCLGRI